MLQKLKTQKERGAARDKTKRAFSLLILIILFVSTAGYAMFYSERRDNKNTYGKYSFAREYDGWKTKIKLDSEDYFLVTRYLPQETEDINKYGLFGSFKIEGFQSIVYFVAKTAAEKDGASEIDKNLIAVKKDYACLPEDMNADECKNLSIKSCSDASSIQKIIVFEEKEDANTTIEYNNNCLRITGSETSIVKAADNAIFMLFGIIKET